MEPPSAQNQGSPFQERQRSPKAETLQALAKFFFAPDASSAFDLTGLHPTVAKKQSRPFHHVPIMKKKGRSQDASKTDDYTDFRKWMEGSGAKAMVDLTIERFAGERGVGAGQSIAPGSQILSVPSRLAFEVNDLTSNPKWCDKEMWKSIKWDAKLAMLLLFEDKKLDSAVREWLDVLPREYNLPCLRPKLLDSLDGLGFTSLCRDVRKQRAEWDDAFKKAPNNPTAEEFDWAMATVRSRAFTGPYTGSTLRDSIGAYFLICTAALAWAVFAGGAGAMEFSYNLILTTGIALLANDFIIGPRFSKMKRHVVCPWIDFLNHNGACEGSEFTYEYFQDAFAAIVDPKGKPIQKGDQVYISYGPRSNDKLLQYYGFIQPNNPHDAYTTDQENLIVGINSALTSGLPDGSLDALKAAGLTDSQRDVDLHSKGADENALRLARLLTHPKLAKNEGLDELPASAEASSRRTLAEVARSRRAELASSLEVLKYKDDEDSRLLADFVKEKKKLLRKSAEALERQASNLEASAGVPVANSR